MIQRFIARNRREVEKLTNQNTRYMYPCEWTNDFVYRCQQNYFSDQEVFFTELEDCTILPAKESKKRTWGEGGIVATNEICEKVRQGIAFGGQYPFSEVNTVIEEETVYYIPVIMKHWGHFLIDVLSRCWFLTDNHDKKWRIAFCSLDFPDGIIQGNYEEALRYLGIASERLYYISRPTRFSRVLVPSASFGYQLPYTKEYIKTIERLKSTALEASKAVPLRPVDRIYFTRTKFWRAKTTEIGEKNIENLFRSNGYHVFSPEKLSLREQIFYIAHCNKMAAMSGTITHNIIFSGDQSEAAILNRTCMPNPPQFALNQLSPAKVTYVDCYSRWTLDHPRDYGGPKGGPIWVEINRNLLQYLKDSGYASGLPNKADKMLMGLQNRVRFLYIFVRMKSKQSRLFNFIYRKFNFVKKG